MSNFLPFAYNHAICFNSTNFHYFFLLETSLTIAEFTGSACFIGRRNVELSVVKVMNLLPLSLCFRHRFWTFEIWSDILSSSEQQTWSLHNLKNWVSEGINHNVICSAQSKSSIYITCMNLLLLKSKLSTYNCSRCNANSPK